MSTVDVDVDELRHQIAEVSERRALAMAARDAASAELAALVREAVAQGASVRGIAQVANVERATIYGWLNNGEGSWPR